MKKQILILIFLLSFSIKSFALDNYYKMLGVPENATQEEIKKGYRRMATKYHPDKHAGSTVATEIFKKVKDAYDVLSDPNKRALFDRQLSMQPKAKPTAQAQAKPAPEPKPQAKPTTDNAKKYAWDNFDQKKEAAKETPKEQAQAKPEPKAQPKPEAAKADTYEFKEKPKGPNPTPGPTFNTENTAMTNTEKAFKGDTSVVKPAAEVRTPFKNPKLDIYNAPSCSKGFLGTVIDVLI